MLFYLFDDAAQREFDLTDFCAFRQLHDIIQGNACFERDIINSTRFRITEVTVFDKVGAKSGWLPVKVDLPDQAVFDQGIKAVVNGSKGDAGYVFPYTVKHLVCCWVIPFFHQNIINFLTLAG